MDTDADTDANGARENDARAADGVDTHPPDARVRAYEPSDASALWDLKERFERELGALGDDDKGERYDGKLTVEYEKRYHGWVDRCAERDPGCVIVAEHDGESGGDDGGIDADGDRGESEGEGLAGYVFVLPEDCALIWDAAVVNELYVREAVRGTGVADALMDAALLHARGQDLPLERIVLDVDGGNDRAGTFYRRHGFEHWGEMVAREL